MPTYGYVCEHCGHEFDEFQSITAKPLRKCPQCGELSLKRLIGCGAGIIFKGSGFYCTDYRGDGYKKAASCECHSTTGKKDAQTESKPSPAVNKGSSTPAEKKKSA